MAETSVKIARKKSTDPIQEALREHKDQWNHEASLLIAQLIAFKKGLNGRGEPRAGLPPSSIKEPIPVEVGQYLDQLASRYEQVIGNAKEIINEQAEYSEHRQKPRQEMAIASYSEDIVKVASWWGSRALTYLKNYGNPKHWGKQEIKDRMFLLRVSVEIVDKLHDIENYILSNDSESIPVAVYNFIKLAIAFEKVLVPKAMILINKPEIKDDPEISIPVVEMSGESKDYPVKNVNVDFNKIKEIQDDLLNFYNISEALLSKGVARTTISSVKFAIKHIKSIADAFKMKYKSGEHLKNDLAAKELEKIYNMCLEVYSKSIMQVSSLAGISIDNINSFSSILTEMSKQKTADSHLSRWLKRKRMEFLPSIEDRLRLELVGTILKCIQYVDEFQDSLEKDSGGINIPLFKVAQSLSEIASGLNLLAKDYNATYEEERIHKKVTRRIIRETDISRLDKFSRYFEELSTKLQTSDE